MKKQFITISCLVLLASMATGAHAQSDQRKESVVHLSLFDPIGTNGREAKEYTNTFSFNVLYGVSKSERAFTFSGLASVIGEDANGVQVAGLANIVGGNTRGLTFAGLTNISDNLNGAAISGLANIAEDVNGLAFSGLVNIAENMRGLQITGLANIAQNTTGLQFAGLGNIAQDFRGIQLSGLGNISQDMSGFQFGGLGNVAESMKGFQIGGIGNVAADARGLQFGGIFNRTEDVSGLQIAGIFNKSKRVRGVQFAPLNIAEENDYPVGLVNLIKDGEKSVSLTFDELQNLTAAFRSGGRVLYGILGVGYNFKSSESLMALEGGFGAHISCTQSFRVNTELTSTFMTEFSESINRSSLRLMAAWKFTPSFEVFAGPSLNYLQTDDEKLFDLLPSHSLWKHTSASGSNERLYVGYLAGVQYLF